MEMWAFLVDGQQGGKEMGETLKTNAKSKRECSRCFAKGLLEKY
jgi:hypothetical protein